MATDPWHRDRGRDTALRRAHGLDLPV